MRCLSLGVVLLVLSPACASESAGSGRTNGQTGSVGSDTPGYATGIGCASVATELAPHADSGLGFDAQTVTDLVSGEHRADFVWTESTSVRSLATGDDGSRTELSVDIEVLGPAQLQHWATADGSKPA